MAVNDLLLARILEIRALKAKSINAFADMLNMPQQSVNQYLTSKRKISVELVLSIASSFEDISLDWLLRGEGPMLKGVPTPESHIYDINYGNKVTGNGNITGNTGPVYAGEDCGLISSSINVTKLQDENAALTAENRDLRQKLDEANTRNAALTDKLLKLI